VARCGRTGQVRGPLHGHVTLSRRATRLSEKLRTALSFDCCLGLNTFSFHDGVRSRSASASPRFSPVASADSTPCSTPDLLSPLFRPTTFDSRLASHMTLLVSVTYFFYFPSFPNDMLIIAFNYEPSYKPTVLFRHGVLLKPLTQRERRQPTIHSYASRCKVHDPNGQRQVLSDGVLKPSKSNIRPSFLMLNHHQ
jgi:hypothetical protein